MPELDNKRRELFAQAYTQTHKGAFSARKAGYKSKNSHIVANQLLKVPEVQERIKELEENTEFTFNVDVIEEMEKQYEVATKSGQTSSALKALELLSKIRGNKSQEEVEMSLDSLETNIVDVLNKISTNKVKGLIEKSNHKKLLNSKNQIDNTTNNS
tara:strand:+ start:114 stop:584 length:471 start_codon:yes stop_codon:yes gene_type:complete